MADFAKYYLAFLIELWNNIKDFFASLWGMLSNVFYYDIKGYIDALIYSAKDFDVLGWISLIVVMLINLTFIFFLFFRLFLFIRRYVFYRSREAHKDMLVEEICQMKMQLENMAKEKAQILGLRLGANTDFDLSRQLADGIGGVPGITGETAKQTETAPVSTGVSRFTKLVKIDEEYTRMPCITKMDEDDNISLSQLIDRFVDFAASQLKLFYSKDIVRRFIAGICTSKVVILEGISGTGKTSLPYAMGKFFHNDSKIVSVQPSWRDRAELIGYLNEFTKKFNETDFLAHLYEVTHRDDLTFIIIDEMNLARIEYYFAEFLSIMEMPDTTEWKVEIVPSSMPEDPINLQNGKILVPQNVWFIGTANQDDSTFTITDKVYDRAVSIEINNRCDYFDAPLTPGVHWSYDYMQMLLVECRRNMPLSPDLMAHLQTIDVFLQDKFRISFGNRIIKQIALFVPAYVGCGGDEIDAFDFMLQSKVLRKLMALNLPFLTKQLADLISLLEKIFGKTNMQLSINYLKRLQKMTA